MKRFKHFLIPLLAVFFFTNVNAQYTGPGATVDLTTVKEVLDNASKLDKSDNQVKLQGYVIEQINNDTFWFKDKSGKIRIEIEKKQ